MLGFRVAGSFGVLRCLCGEIALGQCMTWRTLGVCVHVVVVGVVIHRLQWAGAWSALLLFLGFHRVGSQYRADRPRACLVLVLMVGVMTLSVLPDDSTRGPLFIFLCDMGLWERGYVGYTVG